MSTYNQLYKNIQMHILYAGFGLPENENKIAYLKRDFDNTYGHLVAEQGINKALLSYVNNSANFTNPSKLNDRNILTIFNAWGIDANLKGVNVFALRMRYASYIAEALTILFLQAK